MSLQERQSLTEYFKTLLLTVVGQAFTAAGYTLVNQPIQWAGGQFRFHKPLENGLTAIIEFQLLVYADNMWVSGQPSRFRVVLTRTDQPNHRHSNHAQYVQRDLSTLVVDDFGVAILPSADYWWSFHDTDTLGKALAEAGHLIIGYAMPYLAGDLTPDDASET